MSGPEVKPNTAHDEWQPERDPEVAETSAAHAKTLETILDEAGFEVAPAPINDLISSDTTTQSAE